jgi:hypothetical protein
LIEEGIISDNPSAKSRAQAAYFRGGDIGKNGGKNYLNTPEEKLLEDWILEKQMSYAPASCRDILTKVYIVFC